MKRRLSVLLAAVLLGGGLFAPSAAVAAEPSIAACEVRQRFEWGPGKVFNPGECYTVAGASLYMQHDGNLVVYYNGGWTCATNTAGANGAYAVFQGDGNFVIYYFNYPIWASNTSGTRLIFRGDGTLLIRNAGGAQIWSLC